MASIKSTISLQDKMTNVFKTIKNAANSASNAFKNVSNNLNGMDSKMKSTSSSASNLFGSMLKANLATSAISKLASVITSQLGPAIQRYDTLNNYPKVLKNLGFSAEEATASTQRLSTGLKGLPTSLSDATTGVQRFAAVNNSVEASTEMWLAMNDAILAGGANANTRLAAIEQLTQAYAKGKPEMQEWKSLQQAMPGQLKQIAKAMGYVSDNDLYKALQNGNTTMNEFMKTMIKLDQEGIGGMADFHQQALDATDGIGTAFENLKNSVSRGWTKMFEGADKSLEESGLPKISEIISNLGTGIEDFMTKVGSELIPSVVGFVSTLSEQFGFFKESSTTDTTEALNAWDYFMIGFNTVKLGILSGLGFLQLGVLAMKLSWEVAILQAIGVWNWLNDGVQSACAGIASVLQAAANAVIDFVNVFIEGYNKIADAANNIPGVNMGKGELLSHSTIGDDAWAQYEKDKAARDTNYQKQADNVKNAMGEINDVKGKLKEWGKGAVNDLFGDIGNRKNKSASDKAGEGGGGDKYDPNKIDNLLNNVTGDSGSGSSGGGKAVKTTSTDKNLLSDDDIKLLLDIATRDYKLDYQQITPNITLTFGDIRETADVDDILDKVSDKLEEIYDGNLEVATSGG